MKKQNMFCLLLFSFFVVINVGTAQAKISCKSADGDLEYVFSGMFKPEMFFVNNATLLNKTLATDKFCYAQHTLDLRLNVLYGQKTYARNVAEASIDIRNKSVWGSPESIASTLDSEVKFLDTLTGHHSHSIPRQIFWIRGARLKFDIPTAVGLSMTNSHELSLGLLPFSMGYGIALGEAYQVGPGDVGAFTYNVVNQYAPTVLLHGEVVKDVLEYDVCALTLNNKATNLAETGAKILGQEFGKRTTPERGFGKINYVVAGRLMWYVFNTDALGSLQVQPYGLFNNDPEQKVQFLGDASSRLGTLGLSVEYLHDRAEFGFDYALNLGNQNVKGWDRNHTELAVDQATGFLKQINSQVVDQNNNKVTYNVVSSDGKNIQEIINTAAQSEKQNGNSIGTVGAVELFNSKERFRDGYTNTYEGWMFVTDALVWLYKKDLQLAATVGITSGDDNPNFQTKDGNYSGFIGLQEIYSGKRVKSAFLLSGAGKVKRFLHLSAHEKSFNKFASSVSRFTNLVLTGAGTTWKPTGWAKEFSFNTNVLAYWQEKPSNKFDLKTQKSLASRASTFLGTEMNIFSHIYLVKDMKLYLIGSIFFPGTHFRDIKGQPASPEQAKALAAALAIGEGNPTRIPNVGDNTAYTLNIGIDFRF
jgi:hypothetical protein